jgi:hypothetical protein
MAVNRPRQLRGCVVVNIVVAQVSIERGASTTYTVRPHGALDARMPEAMPALGGTRRLTPLAPDQGTNPSGLTLSVLRIPGQVTQARAPTWEVRNLRPLAKAALVIAQRPEGGGAAKAPREGRSRTPEAWNIGLRCTCFVPNYSGF